MTTWLWASAWLLVGALLWGGGSRHRLRRDHRSQRMTRWRQLGQDWWRQRWRRSQTQSRRRQGAAEFVLALADELSTGLPLDTAVTRAAEGMPWLAHTARAARMGGDIAQALRQDASRFDVAVLASLSAAWQVASGSGAGLAVASRNLGHAAMERERARRELASEMAGPRATARVLAFLPVIGLLLGSGFGGSPWAWLTSTPLGLAVLAVGLALEFLGLAWVNWLVRRVERQL